MRKLPEQEEYLRRNVRDAIALDPLISVRALQRQVQRQTGHSISDKYLTKLRCKVRREVIIESDRKALHERFTEVKERYRVMIDRLSLLVIWKFPDSIKAGLTKPTNQEIISAARTIAQMELALMKAELDIGVFEDRRNVVGDILRKRLLPVELREEIYLALRKWKIGQNILQTDM